MLKIIIWLFRFYQLVQSYLVFRFKNKKKLLNFGKVDLSFSSYYMFCGFVIISSESLKNLVSLNLFQKDLDFTLKI